MLPAANQGPPARSSGKRLGLGVLALAAGTLVWLCLVHLFFQASLPPPTDQGNVEPLAERLAAQHLHLWSNPESRQRELDRMRTSNAEWDFMGRSFLAWGLANLALRHPDRKDDYLAVMDRIIDETLRTEREQGLYHFLMPYARNRPFVRQPARSLFLDGEIALMLGLRRLVEEKPAYQALLQERIAAIVASMQAGPVLCGESYPDECWMFCNAVALAAVRVADYLDGTDHSHFCRRWVDTARKKLIHKETGLLVSSFTPDGRPTNGPEGSSIWMVAHCLALIDEEFARDQYGRARRELGGQRFGFGFAREWPASWQGPADVDSGPVIPLLNISAGSSGMAFVAARSFEDREYYQALRTSLAFAGFPIEDAGRLRHAASNQVGDAVLFYSAVLGPAWEKVKARTYP